MENSLPNAKSTRDPNERKKIRRVVAARGLCGLANDTKWDELIAAMRARTDWRPCYRWKYVDGPAVGWDEEWFHHMPFPMISVEWFDIVSVEDVRIHGLPRRDERIDHSTWMAPLLQSIGLDFVKGELMIRVFGYSPRNMDLFDEFGEPRY